MPAQIVPWILMLIARAGLCARPTWSLWCIKQQVFKLQITGLGYVKHEHNTQVATTDLFSSFVQTAIIHGTLGSSPTIESAARYSHRAHKKISSKVLNITLGGFCWIVVEGDRICHCRLHGPSCNLLPGSHHSGKLEWVCLLQGNMGPIHWTFVIVIHCGNEELKFLLPSHHWRKLQGLFLVA